MAEALDPADCSSTPSTEQQKPQSSLPRSLYKPTLWKPTSSSTKAPLTFPSSAKSTNAPTSQTKTSSSEASQSSSVDSHQTTAKAEEPDNSDVASESAHPDPPAPPCPNKEVADTGNSGSPTHENFEEPAPPLEESVEVPEGYPDDDVGLPLPPPPPPLPILGSPHDDGDVQAENDEVAVNPLAQVMADIRKGASLRKVPEEEKKRTEPGGMKVVDVQSELRKKFMKEKTEKVKIMKSQIDLHQDRIEKVKRWILDAQHGYLAIFQMKKLLGEIKEVQQLVQVTPELMALRISWPTDLIDAVEAIVDVLTALDQAVFKLEGVLKNAESAGTEERPSSVHLNVELAKNTINTIILKVKSMGMAESRYSQAAVVFTVSSSDVGGIIARARDAAAGILNLLFMKGFHTAESVYEPGLKKFDQNFRISNAHRLLLMGCQINDSVIVHLDGVKHHDYSEARLKLTELEQINSKAVNVSRRSGEWDTAEQVVLKSSGSQTMSRPGSSSLEKIVQAVKAKQIDEAKQLLSSVTTKEFLAIEKSLILAALGSEAVSVVLQQRNSLGLDPLSSSKQFEFINEAMAKGEKESVKQLVELHGFNVNCKSSDAGNTPLHVAARRTNLQDVTFLIELGADPLMVSPVSSMSPLQLLAVKEFSPRPCPVVSSHESGHLNLSTYFNSVNLSDVTIVSEEGSGQKKFPAHRIVLCAQSDVFKAMLDSPHWGISRQHEVVLPGLRAAVVERLLEYLYTGLCVFPKDDLNLGVELLAVADQYLLTPMRSQCESHLTDMIEKEIVIPLYYAAYRFSTLSLLQNCCHYILTNYKTLDDPDKEALLHLLRNVTPLDDSKYRGR